MNEIFAFDDFFSSIDFAHRILRTPLSANTLETRERKKNRNDGLNVLVNGRQHNHHGGGMSRRGFDPKYVSKSFVFE